jgi:glycosyltransferase involved in cell wall biosynthesis
LIASGALGMGKKKRILLTSILRWPPGGVETHLWNLSKLLVEHGAEVTVATRFGHPEIPLLRDGHELPVRLVSTPFMQARKPRWRRCSSGWARFVWPFQLRKHFDVMLTIDTTWFVDFLARFVKADGYVLANRAALPLSPQHLDPLAKCRLHGFIAESSYQAERFREVFGLTIPVAAIPHLTNMQDDPPPRRARSVDELHVVYLGRIDEYKGTYLLLDLWPHFNIQPARLDLYGGGDCERVERIAQSMGLEKQIGVHGAFTAAQLPRILEAADLLVLPSYEEGLPLVLMEAMAYGVPFVATDVGAVHTLAQDNPDVLVVPLDNEALIKGIGDMAQAVRSGKIDGQRLQSYHQQRYSYDSVSRRWLAALLEPESWIGVAEMASECRSPAMSSFSV